MSEIIPSWARVGAEVVCVDDTDRGLLSLGYRYGAFRPPAKGTICTVAAHADTYGEPHLIIKDFPNTDVWDDDDKGWHLSRFRPLVTIEDDIEAHFANLLRVPTNQPVDA